MSAPHTPPPWVPSSDGWIVGPDNVDVVEYQGCGSHSAYWPNPKDFLLVLSAPKMAKVVEAAREFISEGLKLTEHGLMVTGRIADGDGPFSSPHYRLVEALNDLDSPGSIFQKEPS